MADKAIRRKAVKECLESYSNDVHKHVKGHRLLRRKNPLGALDLGRLGKAVALSCTDRRAVATAGAPAKAP